MNFSKVFEPEKEGKHTVLGAVLYLITQAVFQRGISFM